MTKNIDKKIEKLEKLIESKEQELDNGESENCILDDDRPDFESYDEVANKLFLEIEDLRDELDLLEKERDYYVCKSKDWC